MAGAANLEFATAPEARASYDSPLYQEALKHRLKGAGVTSRVVQRLLAMTVAIWHNENIGAAIRRSLVGYGH